MQCNTVTHCNNTAMSQSTHNSSVVLTGSVHGGGNVVRLPLTPRAASAAWLLQYIYNKEPGQNASLFIYAPTSITYNKKGKLLYTLYCILRSGGSIGWYQ